MKFTDKVKTEYKVTAEKNITIDEDLGVDYADEGPWRSYQLTTEGTTLEELMENAQISEIDQDGGDLNNYGIDDAPSEVEKAATDLIKKKSGFWSRNP